MHKHKKTKKHYILLILIIIIIIASVAGYFYYQHAWEERFKEEPTDATSTNIDPVYSFDKIKSTLSLIPDFANYSFDNYENEKDNGTYIIPGLKATRTLNKDGEEEMCTSMTPQGVAVIDNYLLISAYCHTKQHNTVIYVLNKETHNYIKEVILPGRPHGGSIAYDNEFKNVWICSRENGQAQVVSFSLNDLKSYSYDISKKPIEYRSKENIKTITSNSFMTYYNGYLYMGYFSDVEFGGAEKFEILPNGTINKGYLSDYGMDESIALYSEAANFPKSVQGITFHDDKLILSISDGPYIPSKLNIYHNDNGINDFASEENLLKSIIMPERMEQVYIDGDDMYVVFESASYAYHSLSLTPCDRVIKIKLSKLLN